MGRKLRVDFSNEQKSGDDDNNQVRRVLSSISFFFSNSVC